MRLNVEDQLFPSDADVVRRFLGWPNEVEDLCDRIERHKANLCSEGRYTAMQIQNLLRGLAAYVRAAELGPAEVPA